jgi:hypothetical protein
MTPNSYVITHWSTGTIYTLDHTGTQTGSWAATGAGDWWNEITYDPVTGYLLTINDSGDICRFNEDGTVVDNIGNVGGDAWAIAFDYDKSVVYWGDCMEGSEEWGTYDLSTSTATTLAAPPMTGWPVGMAYVPMDPDGYTIWACIWDASDNTWVYRYNPDAEVWSTEGVQTVDASVGNWGGIEAVYDFRDGYVDILSIRQGDPGPDLLEIWEGYPLQTWLTMDPMSGSLDPTESDQITITVDPSQDENFSPAAGDQYFGVIELSGPHWNPPADEVALSLDLTINFDVVDGVLEEDTGLPKRYALYQNYPNPFNPSTDIRFDLVEPQQVKLVVYNMLGQEVTRIVDQPMQAGTHTMSFDASRLASGVYFYRIEAGPFTSMRKMVLLK